LTDTNFLVETGDASASFAECSGLTAEVAVIEYREGGDNLGVRKLPGLRKFTNITLRRGITQDKSLWSWFKQTLAGTPQRRDITITLLDEQRQPVVRWAVTNAWPVKWEGPRFNARGNDVAIETLELTHEGLDWVE
jgi:phage tail-like protein